MTLTIKPLKKRDFNKPVDFAIRGMHFDQYTKHKLALQLYGRYFWYDESLRATQLIAAYDGDVLAGVLAADMKGEAKVYHSFWKKLYVRAFKSIMHLLAGKASDAYDSANQAMHDAYAKREHLDGEVGYLAANPDLKIGGVGTFLMAELERREKGKRIYLYTDDNCTYPFYDHRGFERVGYRKIALTDGNALACFLYSKICGA